MSKATGRAAGLDPLRTRSAFIVFVARECDMAALRNSTTVTWTIPSSARPGDIVLVYKTAEGSGFNGRQQPPYSAFVAAAVVYSLPRQCGARYFRATLSEIVEFPMPVPRADIAEAFSEWAWLRNMRGMLG